MTKTSGYFSDSPELQELGLLTVHLARTPRLQKLLNYLAEKSFDGTADQITEYSIATEVFGRKETTFVASEDSIARVQTHRLRKALKAYYETEGQEHGVEISIPLGSYIPLFTRRPGFESFFAAQTPIEAEPETVPAAIVEEAANAPADPIPTTVSELPVQTSARDAAPRSAFRNSRTILALCALLLIGIVLFGVFTSQHTVSVRGLFAHRDVVTSAPQQQNVNVASGPTVALPFRMIAGYYGPAQRDSAGDLWQADQFVTNGWPLHQATGYIAGTSDPKLFLYGRAGDFLYDIPLQPGNYELHLYFFEPTETTQSEDAENKVVFNVTLNDKIILWNFDPVSDANGRNIADERIFHDVVPGKDGKLHLHFSSVIGTPSLRAIAILPGTPHKQLPVRIVTQSTSFTGPDGKVWQPDTYFIGGRTLTHRLPQTDSPIDRQLPSERYGHFTYAIPVDPHDRYTVVLHFEELFFGTEEAGAGRNETRLFRVQCNGNTLLDNFNIFKEAGAYHLLEKTFTHLRPTAQGKLNLTFEPTENYATVSSIEVIDESE